MLIQYFRRGGLKKARTMVKVVDGISVKKQKKGKGAGGGTRKGLFVATFEDGQIKLGWSLCKTSAGDVFDGDRAFDIAVGRAKKGATIEDFPFSMRKKAEKFMARAKAYYKA